MAISTHCAAVSASSTVTGRWARVPSASTGVRQNRAGSVPRRLGTGLPPEAHPHPARLSEGCTKPGRAGDAPRAAGEPRSLQAQPPPSRGLRGTGDRQGLGFSMPAPPDISLPGGAPSAAPLPPVWGHAAAGIGGVLRCQPAVGSGVLPSHPWHRGTKHRCRPGQKWNAAGWGRASL